MLALLGVLVGGILFYPGRRQRPPEGTPAGGKATVSSQWSGAVVSSRPHSSDSRVLEETILDEVKDNSPVEELPFYYLLKKAKALSDDEGIHAKVDVKALFQEPESFRGKLVELVGTVYKLYDYELDDNPSGIRQVYHAELGDSSYQLFTTVFTEPPAGIKEGDSVLVRGYFLKVRSYEDTEGRNRAAPVLVAGKLEKVTSPQTYRATGSFVIILSCLCLGLLVLAFLIWLGRHRRPISFRLGEAEKFVEPGGRKEKSWS